jgi:hypothetical protein
MTRLALAKTLVDGEVTLQGNNFTFTASGSGTATGNTVTEAEKSAIAASNTAAITAARASIDKILTENSAVLADLEITSLISNNLSTTVVVYKPIALSSVATTTDGINYILKPNTIIGSNQWLTVPNGISLKTGTYPVTNNGYFQVGEPSSSVSTTLKTTPTTALTEYTSDFSNNGVVEVYSGSSSTIDAGVTFTNDSTNASFLNYGTCTNNGTMTNNEPGTGVNTYTGGIFNNNSGALINNYGYGSTVLNFGGTFNNNSGAVINSTILSAIGNSNNGTFTNTGSITNDGDSSVVNNYDTSTFTNTGTITNGGNGGTQSGLVVYGGTFNNNDGASISNIGENSYIINDTGKFTNSGTITNSGKLSTLSVYGGTFNNNDGASISNIGEDSYLVNGSRADFDNDGTITNTGTGSYTTNSGTWSGTGTCTGSCAGT